MKTIQNDLERCVLEVDQLRKIINALPDLVIIFQDGKIVHANKAVRDLEKNIYNENFEGFIKENFWRAQERIKKVLETKETTKSLDYDIHLKNGTVIHAEIVSAYIEYKGRPAVLTVARDITEKKRELNSASRMQKMLLRKNLPHIDHTLVSTVYVPSKTVSGDFFFIDQTNTHKLMGILGDVRGKGITAAMKISAFEVLFKESVKEALSLNHLTQTLNERVQDYFDDFYVASLLFEINTRDQVITISGAGINEFMWVDQDDHLHQETIKGPFLGMFNTLEFDQVVLPRQACKRIMLYTDGIEDVLDYATFNFHANGSEYIDEIASNLSHHLEKLSYTDQGLKDDSTAILLNPNFRGRAVSRSLDGLSHYQSVVDSVLKELDRPVVQFNIHLILMELLTNAFKYGNKGNSDLPISIRVIDYGHRIMVQVTDMGLTSKNFSIKKEIKDDELLEESGRGLFLVEQLCTKVIINENSIICEVELKEDQDA